MSRVRNTAGFFLLEMLLGLLLMSVVLAGAVGVFATQSHSHRQQDLAAATQENLRLGMGMVVDALRTGGCGTPAGDLSVWIPWVSGVTTNPTIAGGVPTIAGTTPVRVSIASCFQTPVARLSSAVTAGATVVPVASNTLGQSISDLLNRTTMSLILIGDSENAQVTNVSDSSIAIDTDPATVGTQGLARAYPAGTPIYRVDVHTFSISTDPTTGVPWLGMDLNQGGGLQPVVDGISNLTITEVTANQYRVTMTARSDSADPVTGTFITRSSSSNVTLKN